MTPVVGQALDRVDGRAKVTGAARFAADADVRNVTYAALVQANIAYGRVTSIDASAAGKLPGVLAVISHLNAPKLDPKAAERGASESRIPLSDDVVHYAGQVVAVVVADTLERARHAARQVNVSYAADAPNLPPADFASQDLDSLEPQYTRGKVPAALAAAAREGVLIDATYTTPTQTHSPMEPSATVAVWEGDTLTLYDTTQWLTGVQGVIAAAFGLQREQVRVVCPHLGGAFGCKALIWPHQFIAPLAAKVVGRPVKLVLTRQQMFTACGYRPETVQRVQIGAGKDGRLTAIRHLSAGYTSGLSGFAEACGASSSRSVYACENVEATHRLTEHHVASPTFMRAPGETPGMHALECAMDELAVALPMDPVALRLANLPDKHPANGRPWSSYHLKECFDLGVEKFGWRDRPAAPRAGRAGDALVGWGVATASFPGNRSGAAARIAIDADGHVLAQSATHDLGTGATTIFTQVAADAVGVAAGDARFELGDTAFPRAGMSAGSNTAATVSQAILEAGKALRKKLAELATADSGSPLAGVAVEEIGFGGGRIFALADEQRGETLAALVKRSGQGRIEADGSAGPNRQMQQHAFHSFGAHFCEVQVDELLGRVRVTRLVSVMDIGRVLNPKTARSQVLGGVVMGIGMALSEATARDPRTGYPVTSNFADYAIPVHADIGALEAHFIDVPDPHINELGCRGVGEIGITGVAAAVANAVYHATGKRVRDLPITPDRLL